MSRLTYLLPDLQGHASGALYIPSSQTLVTADVHLGYSWAQRRRGELGPLADSRTRDKLLATMEELQPSRIVFLGDLVHAPCPCAEERAWIEDLVVQLSAKAELIVVRGNHDRAFTRDFALLPIRMLESWNEGSVFALHGDRLPLSVPPASILVVGHLHPSLPVRDAAGAGQKLPVFLASSQCLVLPAFSPFAGGYDLLAGLPSELKALFGPEDVRVYAASPSRVVPLGSLYRAVERMFAADRGAPERFRRSSPGRIETRSQTSKPGR